MYRQIKMKKYKDLPSLEDEIVLLQNEAKGKSLSIEKILGILSDKGRLLILILLCLPFCQPIQIPGLSLPFGLVIAFMGLRVAFRKQAWLPKKLIVKEVPAHTIELITTKALAVIRKLKPWIHPRLVWLSRAPVMEKVNGLILCVLGIFLALPLPIPLSNLTAAWSIFLIALGMLEDDGVCILIGYAISLLTLIFFVVMAVTVTDFLVY